MNGRFTAPALTLALLGGVTLACGTAKATNLGFKLERGFSHVQGMKNIYFVSFPLFNGVGDVCDEGHATNVCQGQVGGGGDGIITACDAACDLFPDISTVPGTALLAIWRISNDCSFTAVQLQKNFIGTIGITQGQGTVLEDFADIGWMLQFTQQNDSDKRVVLAGSHDPSHAGRPIPSYSTCPVSIINVPYHTTYQTAYEILCGLKGDDWVDEMPADGDPDTCPGGIYDDASGAQISLSTFQDNRFEAAQIKRGFLGPLRFPASDFELVPGQAYLVHTTIDYETQNWLSPHF